MKYKTILFDADMTLFDFRASESQSLEELLKERNYPCSPEILEQYSKINDRYWKCFERGEMSRDTLVVARFEEFLHGMNIWDDAAEFNRCYMEKLGNSAVLLDGAKELCIRLSKTQRLYLITNGNSRNQRRRYEKAGLQPYFQDIFISEEIGSQKPQKAYFDYVRANIPNWEPRSTLVVGDSLSSDIQGALDYGLDCCWFNPDNLPYTLAQACTYEIHKLEELDSIL